MIQKLLLLCCSLMTFALITAGKDGGETVLKASGSHISSTGAPGEQTCAQSGCHVDATLTNEVNNEVTTLTLGNGEKTYNPATFYTITLKAVKAGVRRFGFQIVALDTNGRSVGTLNVPQGNAKVQRQKGDINGEERMYITHTTSGNKPAVTGQIEWQFTWSSNPGYQGKVTFYYCVNATNMDNTNAGDQLYLNAIPFNATTSGVEENATTASAYQIYPTIAQDNLTIKHAIGFPNSTSCRIVSMSGAMLLQDKLNALSTSATIPLETLPNGCYMVQIVSGASISTTQFIVQR